MPATYMLLLATFFILPDTWSCSRLCFQLILEAIPKAESSQARRYRGYIAVDDLVFKVRKLAFFVIIISSKMQEQIINLV